MKFRTYYSAMSLFALVTITGCSPTSTKLSKNTQLINCSGAFNSIDACVVKAREVCGDNYDVLSVKEDDNDYKDYIGLNGEYGIITPSQKRSMVIKCN